MSRTRTARATSARARPKARASAPSKAPRSRSTAKPAGRRRNPSDTLQSARRRSTTLNGRGAGDVVELAAKERQLSRYLIPIGNVTEIAYKVRKGKRAGAEWAHKSGDTGTMRMSGRRPLLCADARTNRPVIIPAGSAMRLSSKRGLVG